MKYFYITVATVLRPDAINGDLGAFWCLDIARGAVK